jgi:hypothetical protein
MKVEHADIIWCVSLSNIELPDDATVEEKQALLLQKAQERFDDGGFSDPIIHDCSDSDLIE